MGKLMLEKDFVNDEKFMKIVKEALEEYNKFCDDENMEECKISLDNLLINEFVYLSQVAELYYVVFIEDVPENKVLTIIEKGLFTNKCKRIL